LRFFRGGGRSEKITAAGVGFQGFCCRGTVIAGEGFFLEVIEAGLDVIEEDRSDTMSIDGNGYPS
jgi:hypothetical protein